MPVVKFKALGARLKRFTDMVRLIRKPAYCEFIIGKLRLYTIELDISLIST